MAEIQLKLVLAKKGAKNSKGYLIQAQLDPEVCIHPFISVLVGFILKNPSLYDGKVAIDMPNLHCQHNVRIQRKRDHTVNLMEKYRLAFI